MKLTGAKTYVVKTDPPNWGGILWFFLKLETDEGLEGWGETAVLSCLFGLEESYERRVQEVFNIYLRDKDPIDREPIYQTLYAGLTSQHPDYVALGLISAFDIALWDIAGKYHDTPVYDLLGGKYRDRVRTYTYVYDLDAEDTIIVPVPDTSKAAADSMAYQLSIPCREGLIRNRYAGRTFIEGGRARKAKAATADGQDHKGAYCQAARGSWCPATILGLRRAGVLPRNHRFSRRAT